ncbi:MipA/OmpV family protein [Endozoicomonadaceae bacterium StTr2]
MITKSPKTTSLLLAASIAAASSSASAFELSDDLNLSLGLGAASSSSIYKGQDSETTAIPVIELEYKGFYISGLEAGYNFIDNDNFNFYAAIAGDTLDGKRKDSKFLKDMKDVDSGVNLKLGGELYTEFGILGASVAQDVSSEHKGTEVELDWSVPFDVGTVSLMPTVYATWMSDKLTNHYFGVEQKYARADRKAYDADASWRYGVNLMAQYPLSEQWTLAASVGSEWYSKEIKDSPIVDDNRATMGYVAVSYTF